MFMHHYDTEMSTEADGWQLWHLSSTIDPGTQHKWESESLKCKKRTVESMIHVQVEIHEEKCQEKLFCKFTQDTLTGWRYVMCQNLAF